MALPLDLENVLCADVLAAEARRGPVTLVEQFPAADQLCATGPEGHFVHELIVPVRRTDVSEPTREQTTQRVGSRSLGRPPAFPPGETWLTTAIYGSEATLDRLLHSSIAPLVERSRSTGAVDGWFFIRYWDPGAHLRVRFHGAPHRLRDEAWPALQQDLSARWQRRDPHGSNSIPTFKKSTGMAARKRSQRLNIFLRPIATWCSRCGRSMIMALRTSASVPPCWPAIPSCADFELDEGARETLAAQIGAALTAERIFAPDVDKALSERFRTLRGGLNALLADPSERSDEWERAARGIIARRSGVAMEYRDICQRLDREGVLTAPISDILGSLIHMQVNRLMRGAPRAIELVIYDMLRRNHRSNRARKHRA